MRLQKKDIIPVFMCCNNAYAQHCGVAIMSAVTNSKSRFKFYIIHSDLGRISKMNLKRCALRSSVKFIKTDKSFFESKNINSKLPQEACYRFIISELNTNLDKAIYLDCDLIVCSDLKDLFDIDIENNYAGVVDDFVKKEYVKKLGLNRYFNSGVLLLNLKKLKDDKVYKKFISKMDEIKESSKFLDQDVLNIVLKDKVKFLELKWNAISPIFRKRVFNNNITEQQSTYENPAIVHFTGPDKPWVIPEGIIAHPFCPAYFYYLLKTPYLNSEKEIKEKFKIWPTLFWYLKRHLLFFFRMQFYKMRMLHAKNKIRYAINSQKYL